MKRIGLELTDKYGFISTEDDANIIEILEAFNTRVDSWKKRPGKLRFDDWDLEDQSYLYFSRIELIVSRWESVSLYNAWHCFIGGLKLPSCTSDNFDEISSVLKKAIASLEKGHYTCGVCFDEKKTIKFGLSSDPLPNNSDITKAKIRDCINCNRRCYSAM